MEGFFHSQLGRHLAEQFRHLGMGLRCEERLDLFHEFDGPLRPSLEFKHLHPTIGQGRGAAGVASIRRHEILGVIDRDGNSPASILRLDEIPLESRSPGRTARPDEPPCPSRGHGAGSCCCCRKERRRRVPRPSWGTMPAAPRERSTSPHQVLPCVGSWAEETGAVGTRPNQPISRAVFRSDSPLNCFSAAFPSALEGVTSPMCTSHSRSAFTAMEFSSLPRITGHIPREDRTVSAEGLLPARRPVNEPKANRPSRGDHMHVIGNGDPDRVQLSSVCRRFIASE